MSTTHDVVIAGAGPGGSSAAHYLARSGLRVLLLDKADFPRDKTCGDGLTPRAVGMLHELGLLDDMLRAGRRIDRVEVVAPSGRSTSAPIRADGSRDHYTLIVPRLTLDHGLRDRAVASGAAFEGRTHVVGVQADAEGVIVRAERDGRPVSVRARMAVVATGANLKLLRAMGLVRKTPPMMLATRAYFEGLRGLGQPMQIRFDGVPMPGYGWVFPLSDSSANVGAGYFTTGWAWRRPDTSRAAFDAFVQHPPVRALLEGARPAGPIRGYPIRVDFTTAPTFGERVLLLGEAAGLVNPMTGEGIDYALESGKLAAEHLAGMFARGDFSPRSHAKYDRLLRRRYQRLFRFCERVRGLCTNAPMLNRLVPLAERRADLKMLLVNIALGNQDVVRSVTPRMILGVLLRTAVLGG